MIGLLALAPPPGADEVVKVQTPREQYEALLKEYDAPRAEYLSGRLKAKPVSERFLKFAREHSDDPASIDALEWVVTHTLFTPEAGSAMELLARDYVKSDKLAAICRKLNDLYGSDFQPLESMLRVVLRDSPDRETWGWACFTLARRLKFKKENAERDIAQHKGFNKGDKVPYVVRPALKKGDLDRWTKEAEALYEQAAGRYGDLKSGEHETLADSAMRELSELLRLAVGQAAPEIDGTDVDGRRFQLSGYRGKVWSSASSATGAAASAAPSTRRTAPWWSDSKGSPSSCWGSAATTTWPN